VRVCFWNMVRPQYTRKFFRRAMMSTVQLVYLFFFFVLFVLFVLFLLCETPNAMRSQDFSDPWLTITTARTCSCSQYCSSKFVHLTFHVTFLSFFSLFSFFLSFFFLSLLTAAPRQHPLAEYSARHIPSLPPRSTLVPARFEQARQQQHACTYRGEKGM